MYTDTIVLSGPDVMLSSSASVAASHSPRPLSAPIGSLGSVAATAATAVSRMSALRGAGQLTVPFGMVSAIRPRSPLAARRRIRPPSLRLVKEMLQAVARRVRVSQVQRAGGEG